MWRCRIEPMKRLLCIGDSNTWGYDPRSYTGGRYAPDVRWIGLLSGWETVNDGQNGRRIPEPREYPDTVRLHPETFYAVSVMLGTNDLLLGASASKAAENMDPFLRFLLGIAGGTKLLLIAPPPFQPGEWVTQEAQIRESKKLAGAYASLAQKLDIAFADAGRWSVGLCFDGVHFTPEGHTAFAGGLSKVLDRI